MRCQKRDVRKVVLRVQLVLLKLGGKITSRYSSEETNKLLLMLARADLHVFDQA